MLKIEKILNILIIVILLTTIAVRREGKLLGKDAERIFKNDNPRSYLLQKTFAKIDEFSRLQDYKLILDPEFKLSEDENEKYILPTSLFTDNIFGYGGKIDLYIVISNNRIEQIILGENGETEWFLNKVKESKLLAKWNGLYLQKIANNQPDAISGATFTSNAIIESIETTITKIKSQTTAPAHKWIDILTISDIAAILALVLGIFLSIRKKRIKYSRSLLLIVNVVVLGFWCGSFLSVNLLTNWLSNGLNIVSSLILVLTLLVAIIMPFVGKKEYYCKWVCPFGSAQELIYSIGSHKITLSAEFLKNATKTKEIAILILIALMWLGVGLNAFDYEPFAAFLFTVAELPIIIIAILALLLSIFINRPWCKFVCPTGQLATWAEKL